ncbi:polysaccharide biosynthesis tyrosine autokinase [Scytonema hofmannii FACHB-248]|uniref:Polysaccharide biosynthesis tyrosine autokinase n=1 Tax=Scytonema hofmannii FACHB-248 TaxID=1842502 RepID=A0ABR8GY54_9CYAN|nr:MULTISPECIES: polysaccharide biosynthesis tyrosine autokinase [Nostocales]MBD2608000.1 polysaccharide biosynthesis tyrosine autokinase [Scytonema hofmannii FACHB-248]
MEKGISSLLAVLKRRALPALVTFTAVIGGAFAYLTVTPRLYQASARLIQDDRRVSVSELGRDLTSVSSGAPGGPSPLANQAELVKSERVLERAIALASLKSSNNGSPTSKITSAELNKGLGVKIVPATNILELSYKSKDPELAAQLLNAVSQAMIEENTKTISSEATKVREFLENSEIPNARKRVATAERKESQYRYTSGIISFEEQTKSAVESLATLEDQERSLTAQLQEAKGRDASLRQITNAKSLDKAYASVRGGQDEQLKTLRAKLTELNTKLIEARLRLTENHPSVIALVGERDQVNKLYTEQLARVSPANSSVATNSVAGDQISQDLTSKFLANETERSAIENKLKTVKAQRTQLQISLTRLPIQQQPLIALTREREDATASLKSLQSKLEEARITEAQKVSNLRLIEAAKPPIIASSPHRSAVLALAVVFGTVLGTGVMLLLEVLDNTLKDASEAEELLSLPLLGVLPRLPAKTLVLEPADRFLDDISLVEPYRMLLKTLEFRSNDKVQIIVVSSTLSGEGKSIVASHLAAISAMLSRRTLIIDADLRRPMQHTLFNLAPKPGITDVIEKRRSLKQAVQPTEIDNLHVLTGGEFHGRPSQLLESLAMKSLVAEAAANYDMVIIDTAPISACADAATLARQSDGIMLVTRPSITIKEVLQRAVSELEHNQIPVLGVVVNGMTQQTEKYLRYPVDNERPVGGRSLKRLIAVEGGRKNAE